MVSVWFTSLFAFVGLGIIILFACRNGVFGEWCSSRNHGNGTTQPTGYGIGIGERTRGHARGHARDEGMDSSEVTTRRAESEEEGAYGDTEEESRRSGGLSADERSQEDEDWGGAV